MSQLARLFRNFDQSPGKRLFRIRMLAAVALFVFSFGFSCLIMYDLIWIFGLHTNEHSLQSFERWLFAVDCVESAGIALLGAQAITWMHKATLHRARRSDTLGTLNHHIRNALTPILLHAHMQGDSEMVRLVQEAVDRVLGVLQAEEGGKAVFGMKLTSPVDNDDAPLATYRHLESIKK